VYSEATAFNLYHKRHLLLANHIINKAEKCASVRKQQISLSILRGVTHYHPLSIGHKVYNAASNDIYCTTLKAKGWTQDEELPNPAIYRRSRTAAACRYVSPCVHRQCLMSSCGKFGFKDSLLLAQSDDRNYFHASGCQDLSKNVQCVSLTISVSLFLYLLR